jgi:clathrin heavy chain
MALAWPEAALALQIIGISRNLNNLSTFTFKVKDAMQLYSKDRGVSPNEGHVAAFTEIKQDGHQSPTKLFSFSVQTATGTKVCLNILLPYQTYNDDLQLHVVEIDHTVPDPPFVKKAVNVYFPQLQMIFLSQCKF